MISSGQLMAFGLASFLIIVIPGPSVLFVIGRALVHGRRTALASAAGNDLGVMVLAVAVAFGLGSLVERSVVVFTAMKLVGAAYLIFLGVRAFRRRGGLADLELGGESRGGWRAGLDGFLVGVANPKTVVFLVAVLPQFVNHSQGHVPAQMMLLGLVFTMISLISDSIWSIAASAARGWFGRSPRRMRLIGGAGGLTMIGLGLSVAVTGSRD